jgi:TRAP-type C4-dicarboxylate transport system permease small subunit
MVSGAAWLAAALVFLTAGPRPAFFTLFVCGLAIAPVAQMVTKFVFNAPPAGPGKRLEWIAVATVPVLLAGFYFGWRGLAEAPFAAIPIVAIAVGLRYLAFPVMYGGAFFAGLGAAFIAGGAAGLALPESAALPMTLGLALTELAAGTLLARRLRAGPTTA